MNSRSASLIGDFSGEPSNVRAPFQLPHLWSFVLTRLAVMFMASPEDRCDGRWIASVDTKRRPTMFGQASADRLARLLRYVARQRDGLTVTALFAISKETIISRQLTSIDLAPSRIS